MKVKRDLWVFHHYATLPNLNGHIRPYRFAEYLAKEGYSTAIFASSYQHFSGNDIITDRSRWILKIANSIPFVFVHTPPSEAGGFARINNMLAFYRGLFGCCKQYEKQYGKPNVIIASSPHPLAMLAGIKVARKYGVPCICEVRDLWPEAIFTARGISEKSITGKMLTAFEYWIYRHADALIFTKEGDTDYLKEKGWTTAQGGDIDLAKCYYINNGVDLQEYDRQISENIVRDPDLDNDAFRVIYAGAIRPVNHVEGILDTARLLVKHDDIKFLIYGDGNQRNTLQERAIQEGLSNVAFKGFIEKKYIPFILSRSSVNLLNYSDTKYNWSRGNSSNKLFEYMASGKPVISTVKTGYSIINRYGCGIELVEFAPQALASAILSIKEMPQKEYDRLCASSRNGVKDFDYVKLAGKLIEVIESVLG